MIRYLTYFIIFLIFIAFTVNALINIESRFNVDIEYYDYFYTVLVSMLFSSFSVLVLQINRKMTQNYGKFIMKNSLLAMKFNMYVIQILVFLLWTFVLSYIIEISYGVFLADHPKYFIESIVLSFLYGISIDLFLNGMSIFKRKK